MIISRRILLRMRKVWDKVVEKIEIYILCSITLSKNHALYAITWENMVERDM